ncbi:hypothetical protein Esti_004166 [Eimeria stiedai]
MQDPTSLQVSLFPSGPVLHLVKVVGALDVPPRDVIAAAVVAAIAFAAAVTAAAAADVTTFAFAAAAAAAETLEAALQSARVQFALDDFTGRIECEFTVGDELTEYRHSQILDALCCGGLVCAFGSINLLGKNEPALRVHAVRRLSSAADLIYHESACQLTYLRLKYPNEDPEGAAAPGHPQQQQQPPLFGMPQQHKQQPPSGSHSLGPCDDALRLKPPLVCSSSSSNSSSTRLHALMEAIEFGKDEERRTLRLRGEASAFGG